MPELHFTIPVKRPVLPPIPWPQRYGVAPIGAPDPLSPKDASRRPCLRKSFWQNTDMLTRCTAARVLP